MVLAPQLLILRASGRLVGKQEVQAGLVVARIQVADMLDRGDGYVKDQAAAVEWYQAAAEQGDVYAMTELGAHLRLGKGVAWSEAQAMQWFAKAAQQNMFPRSSWLFAFARFEMLRMLSARLMTRSLSLLMLIGSSVQSSGAAKDRLASLPWTETVPAASLAHFLIRTHRQQGIGRLLVNAVLEWARLRRARGAEF